MPNQAEKAQADQKTQAIAQIANVSRLLRDAISAAIPVAPEQYLTVSIPGTAIDTRDISEGGTFAWDAQDGAFAPTQVMQAEGKLVDNMIPLSYVMVGNTGKSVARSYSRALDCLVARKASVSTGKHPNGENDMRSPGDKSYDDAMKFLTTPLPNGFTPVDLYVEKQDAWRKAQDEWDTAILEAKNAAKAQFPNSPVHQVQAYNDWNQAHYRKYKTAVQGRYIDWVTNGHKFNVEQNFGIVDVDSIMGRIEQSKESIRNSVVVDADGSNEVNLVTLTPKNWATLCRKKEEGWFERNGHYSLEQLQAEIERLERLQTSYVAMGEAMGFTITLNPKLSVTGPDTTKIKYPVADPGGSPSTKPADDAAKAAFKATYEAQGALADAERKLRQNTDKSQDQKHKDDVKAKEAALNEKRKELANKTAAQQDAHSEYAKWAISTMNDQDSKDAARKWLERTINGLVTNIKHLKALGKDKLDSKIPSAIANTTAKDEKNPEGVNGTVNAVDEDNKPRAMFLSKAPESKLSTTPPGNPKMAGNDPRPQGGSSDPWTTISASFSASDQTSTANTSSWGMSVGGTVGWGGFSAGGSYAHEQSKSDFTADMASCDVSVSFSCLVVNIGRPWLYGEVFADSELDTAAGINLSPGARELKDWMAKQKGDDPDPQKYDEKCIDELQKYSMFPAYPTSFIVAADTTIEFHGNTQHMEKHFSAQSNSGSVSVGWGPFSVNSSFHQSSSKQSFQLQSTATGCRLSFGAPQVIGWVSQILPMLPRPTGYEPMLQRDGTKTA